MATFCVEIPDAEVDRVITAICANYQYNIRVPDPNAIDPITGEPLPAEGEMDTLGDVPLEPDGAITNGQLGKDTKKAEI